jgi:hypothetical protein
MRTTPPPGVVEENDITSTREPARFELTGELGHDVETARGGSGGQSVGERPLDSIAACTGSKGCDAKTSRRLESSCVLSQGGFSQRWATLGADV